MPCLNNGCNSACTSCLLQHARFMAWLGSRSSRHLQQPNSEQCPAECPWGGSGPAGAGVCGQGAADRGMVQGLKGPGYLSLGAACASWPTLSIILADLLAESGSWQPRPLVGASVLAQHVQAGLPCRSLCWTSLLRVPPGSPWPQDLHRTIKVQTTSQAKVFQMPAVAFDDTSCNRHMSW